MQYTECELKEQKRGGLGMRLHCVIFVEGQSEILCTYLPQEVTIGLLKAAMLTSPGTKGFLIDGFPRELQQGRMFTKQVPIVEYIIIVQLPNTILPKWVKWYDSYHSIFTKIYCMHCCHCSTPGVGMEPLPGVGMGPCIISSLALGV